MVYLLKFRQPVGSGKKFVRYYMGYCEDHRIEERLAEHRAGQGARLTQVASERGIDFDLVRTWAGASRKDERRMKNQRNHKKFDKGGQC